MKNPLLFAIIPFAGLLSVAVSLNSCSKSDKNPVITDPPQTSTVNIIYRRADTSFATPSELWSVKSDGSDNHVIPITMPVGWALVNDVAAVVSPDSKMLALGLIKDSPSFSAIYTCNIDGSNVKPVLTTDVNTLIYIQDFIGTSSILYWRNNDGNNNSELWRVGTNGTGNQKLNITLPTNVSFGDGFFAKVTTDGKTIIFSTIDYTRITGNAAIYKYDISTSGVSLVTDGLDGSLAIQALVNNTAVLYRTENTITSAPELWAVNIDGSNKHQLTGSLPTGLSLQDQGAAKVSSNALFMATTTAGVNDNYGQEAIYTAGVDGANVKLVTQILKGYSIALEGIQQ